MLFSGVIFLTWFLPLFVVCYHLLHPRFRNVFILAASILFYAWGAPKFVFVLLLTTFLDFHFVRWMSTAGETGNQKRKNFFLGLSLALNLGLLAWCKYSNFFIDNLNEILQAIGIESVAWTRVVMPLGISFFTFESLTYVFDIYRGKEKPLSNFWNYQLYIFLFPKLVAGPIVRYHDIADQISDRSKNETTDAFLTGFFRFVIGLSKKLFIANPIGSFVLPVFQADTSEISSSTAWMALAAMAIEIYVDFSAYSDMALGICKIIGFRIPENFNNPYLSGSITEFWQRWHISLGNWMRNYLYIPLGGNQKGVRRTYLNLWVVFLVTGIWHGPFWTLLIWGAWHGTFLMLDRLFMKTFLEKTGIWVGRIFTFFIVAFCMGLFQIEDTSQAFSFYGTLFNGNTNGAFKFSSPEFWAPFLIAIFVILAPAFPFGKRIQEILYADTHRGGIYILLTFLLLILFVACLSTISTTPYSPFLYFRF